MKTHLAFAVILLCVAAATCAQDKNNDQNAQKFDAAALFQPHMSTIQSARETCANVPGPQFGECFVQQIQAAGASSQAVAFMHAIHNDGFMHGFKATGRVDIAFVLFPFAANENEHCLLVNGAPNLIDVDDYSLLPKDDLQKNQQYASLFKQYPNIAVFPGDRTGTKFISAKKLPDGGQRFLVPYVLVDGCHACTRVGLLQLAFDFDNTGKFLGAKVTSVKPLPPPPPPSPTKLLYGRVVVIV